MHFTFSCLIIEYGDPRYQEFAFENITVSVVTHTNRASHLKAPWLHRRHILPKICILKRHGFIGDLFYQEFVF